MHSIGILIISSDVACAATTNVVSQVQVQIDAFLSNPSHIALMVSAQYHTTKILGSFFNIQLRAKLVFEPVRGIIDLIVTWFHEASQLYVGTLKMFNPCADDYFSAEHSWYRQ